MQRCGLWRLAGCMPMREKHPQTEKQRQLSTRLGLQLNSRTLIFLSRRSTGVIRHAYILAAIILCSGP
ncbi:hypothetical protein CWN35_16600 [Klebsiella pneumoniae]|nr:hypothetical protein CWN20_07515 [Klebsiella pneumoniae]PLL40948.1 hypothetical protein CWN30_02545 [Klebsiella pneumoniae]PLM78378.1 hypothetical protein CWN12_07630 [Klebsiella pneumoniae]PLM80893.1 hypothetical protein CWN35_16600 [Klebsiella pneumoniae]PLN89010.1 hypothetical protein CWN64_19375 [Klebsiella pneumoniae]